MSIVGLVFARNPLLIERVNEIPIVSLPEITWSPEMETNK